MNDYQRLRKILLKDISSLPYWIDTKKQSNKDIWDTVGYIIEIFSKCNVPRVLVDRTISVYNAEITELILDIVSICETDEMEIQVSHYLISSLNKYIELASDYELYEVAANLNNLKNKYMVNA